MALKRRKEIGTTETTELMSQGEQLAQWLNGQQDELKGIASLLDDMRAFEAACQKWPRTSHRSVRECIHVLDQIRSQHDLKYGELHANQWKKILKHMPPDLFALHQRVTKQLSRYDTRPLPLLYRGRVLIDYSLLNEKVRWIEDRAFRIMRRLSEHGKLAMLRRCGYSPCGKWMFGSRHDQRFCGTEHRQADFESSPEQKEKRRKRAREEYATKLGGSPRPYRRKPQGAA
jgi:hypothetical protein